MKNTATKERSSMEKNNDRSYSNGLPPEFKRSITDSFDRRYVATLLSSIAFHCAFVVYFLFNPLTQDESYLRISEIQQRLARTIKAREVKLELVDNKIEPPKPKPEEKKEIEAKKPGNAPESRTVAKSPEPAKPAVRKSRRARGQRGGKSEKEIASAVSSKGILALLTSSGSTASGNEVADILDKSSQSQKDLDKAISGLSGIRSARASDRSGTGRTNVRGGRSEGSAGIDDMVSGLEEASTGSFERSGDLVVINESPLIEGGNSGIAGRNQGDIQGVVLRHNKSIQYCYERQLKRNPNLRGKIVVRFTITPQGSVTDVKIVSSDLNNRKVEQCVINRIRRWNDFGQVDASKGSTTIRQAYTFGY